jgi:hypothetical protein
MGMPEGVFVCIGDEDMGRKHILKILGAVILCMVLVASLFPVLQGQKVAIAEQVELVTNGGFESGETGWAVNGDFYADSRFANAHDGTGYAYLSNPDGTYGNDLGGTIEQTVTIPPSISSATLTFWYSITTTEHRKHLDTITTELDDSNRRLDCLYDSLESGELGINDLAPRIQKLRHQQDQLEAAREELKESLAERHTELADVEFVVKYVEDLRNLLSHSSLAEQKAFIRSFVKEVTVVNNEAMLKYTIPLPPEGILHERAGVLSIVQLGSAYGIRTRDLRLERAVS